MNFRPGAALVDTPLIVFLNPDAELVGDAIDRLAEASCRYPGSGAFNPAIEHPNEEQFFRKSNPFSPSRPKPPMPRGWPSSDRQVPVVTGAALLGRKSDFDSIGEFDPKVFLHNEDDDLCLRLEASCGPLMFIRNARVIHRLGGSSGTGPGHSAHEGTQPWPLTGLRVADARKTDGLRAGADSRRPKGILALKHHLEGAPHLGELAYLQGVLGARRLNPSAGTRLRKWILRGRTGAGQPNG